MHDVPAPVRPRWPRVGLGVALGAWVVAMGFAVAVRLHAPGPSVAAERAAEQQARDARSKLRDRQDVQRLERLADEGNVRVMLRLANAYAAGTAPVPKDSVQAFAWRLRAAKAGSVVAMVGVAEAYRSGAGAMRNARQALAWYERAANRGSVAAARILGAAYFEGQDVPVDYGLAMKWYQRAANAGDAEARMKIAQCYEEGLGIPRDETTAFYLYAQVAEAGDARAQDKVGQMLMNGRGVERDPDTAVHWFSRAAAQGDLGATTHLAMALRRGTGIERDEAEGRRLLERAASRNDFEAVAELAQLDMAARSGRTLKSDPLELLRGVRSDEMKLAEAEAVLKTPATSKDTSRGYHELEAGLAKGQLSARVPLAKLLITGAPGVPKDWPRARQLLQDAARDGGVDGLTWHSVVLRNGIGGPSDLATANAELREAVERNDGTAKRLLAAQHGLADYPGLAAEAPAALLRRIRDRRESPAAVAAAAPAETVATVPSPAPPAPAGDGRADERPVALKRVEPQYPLDLRMLNITGEVIVDFIVDREGNVAHAFAVKSSLPGFEPAAIAAVSEWRFRPGLKGGQRVDTHMQVPIVFTLRDDDPSAGK